MKRYACILLACAVFAVSSCSSETASSSDPSVSESITIVDTASSVSSKTTEESTSATTTAAPVRVQDDEALYESYYSIVLGVIERRTIAFAGGPVELNDIGEYAIDNSHFAVCDVDSDGIDELLIYWENGAGADLALYVCEFDTSTGDINKEMVCTIDTEFYDNGLALIPLSHNQGYAQTIWPYQIAQYDPCTDTYELTGYVDCMDRSVCEQAGVEFPEEYDTDNAGVVYMIDYEGYAGEDGGYCYSQSDYDEFRSSLIEGTNPIDIEQHCLCRECAEEYLHIA